MDFLKYRPVFLALLFALAVITVFGVYDVLVLEIKPQMEGPPEATPYRLFRGASAMLAAVLVVIGILSIRSTDAMRPEPAISAAERGVIQGIAALSLATLVLFYVNADLFSQISSEDGIIEWVSAFALLAATICLSVSSVLGLREGTFIKGIAFGGLALGCFIVGMEEISWGQRLIGFDSPDAFMKYNKQDEFNLHNLSTDLAEIVYYTGAVGFLILLPFLHDVSPLVPEDHPLSSVIPGRAVIFASALVAAYNWDMWRVIPVQIGFYVTVLIVIYYLIHAAAARATAKAAGRATGGDLAMIALVTFSVIINQASFLIWGDRQSWTWATTEYKELFIPLGLLFYAVSALGRRRTG